MAWRSGPGVASQSQRVQLDLTCGSRRRDLLKPRWFEQGSGERKDIEKGSHYTCEREARDGLACDRRPGLIPEMVCRRPIRTIPIADRGWAKTFRYTWAAPHARSQRDHGAPRSNVQSAPPPALCAISRGSMVHTKCARLSKIEPAAPSDGTPASARVA